MNDVEIGMIGLGKMGANLALNMQREGFRVVGTDLKETCRQTIQAQGIETADSLTSLLATLPQQKIVWMMVPAGEPTEVTCQTLLNELSEHDIVIDGGNSNYKESQLRAARFAEKGIHFLDVGTSGGTSGANQGACLMIGGEQAIFEQLAPLFKALAVDEGFMYTGPAGSGHFLKMVHNGVEYGMMQAIAEGFEVLEGGPFDYDLAEVANVWNHGSVIRSWLMELAHEAFVEDPKLEAIKGVMHSSGEGKWTVETALDYQIPTPVIALSLMMRYRSMYDDTFTGKVVAALRNGFGGHAIEKND